MPPPDDDPRRRVQNLQNFRWDEDEIEMRCARGGGGMRRSLSPCCRRPTGKGLPLLAL